MNRITPLFITIGLTLLAACAPGASPTMAAPMPTATPLPPQPSAPPAFLTALPTPTLCLEPRPLRTLPAARSRAFPNLAAAQAAVPFTLAVPAGWESPPVVQRIDYTEAETGERYLSVFYEPWKPGGEWPTMNMEIMFAQSKQPITEYLRAGLVNACAYTPVTLGRGPGFTFWDAGPGKSNAAVLIWQEGEVKISIWLNGQGAAPTDADPHPWDRLLRQIADSMKPV